MDKKEWLDWRQGGLGASDAPAVMGVSPWKTLHELWTEKVFGAQEQEESFVMRRGKELEPLAIDWFMGQTGIILEEQKCVVHPEYPWMRATLDGICEDEKVLVEIKSCRVLHDEVPAHYYPQLQHQLAIMGYSWGYYLSFNGQDGKLLKVEADEKYIKKLIKKEEEFWHMVENKIEPEKPESALRDMNDNQDWQEIAERYLEAKNVSKALQEEIKFLESQFILFADGKPAYGAGVKALIAERSTVDYKAAFAKYNISEAEFKNPSAKYWRFYLDKKLEA